MLDHAAQKPGTPEEYIRLRIARGVYKQPDRLPSCRDLAQRLRVSRNAAWAAYRRLLRDGVISGAQGSRFRVSADANLAYEGLIAALKARLRNATFNARDVGYSRAELALAFEQVVAEAFAEARLIVAFVECSTTSVATLGADIASRVDAQVRRVLLTDDCDQLRSDVSGCQLVATTLSHLREVEEMLAMRGQVVRLRHVPDTFSLLRISCIPRDAATLVVAANDGTLRQLTRTVTDYHGVPRKHVLDCHVTAADVSLCDALVSGPTAWARVAPLWPASKLTPVVVTHSIDGPSIAHLNSRIDKAQSATRDLAET